MNAWTFSPSLSQRSFHPSRLKYLILGFIGVGFSTFDEPCSLYFARRRSLR